MEYSITINHFSIKNNLSISIKGIRDEGYKQKNTKNKNNVDC
jgi:hypothetical protein